MITGFFRGGGGWRNGSTCERAVTELQSRLRNLKKEREKRVQDRTGRIARFVDDGDVGAVFVAAEQIVREENAIRILELLYHSCEIVVANLTYIRRHSDCPREINKAVSTLAFAAPRCPDLLELWILRQLFFERYGEFYDVAAADAASFEGFRGSCVDSEVAERLESRHARVPYPTTLAKVCAILHKDVGARRRGISTTG
ncbi:unnamed protein product [Linum tenue]|uniref:IST1-like protein n=1 Tax=Linum tenue TaxID=586396 RepID=A0AAV0MII1_9ROSI|nr:unnamed protein product [Linum tenue]